MVHAPSPRAWFANLATQGPYLVFLLMPNANTA